LVARRRKLRNKQSFVHLGRACDVGAAQFFYDREMASFWKSTTVTLEMIKWEHSVFALPFALTGAVLAADGWPARRTLFWIVVCMVSARTAAMAFNRLADAKLDAENPRTAMRAIPAGTLSSRFVGGFVVVSVAVFVLGAAMLNRLTLELAPVALAVVLLYSYMKRVTRWSHLVLGLALGIAPTAAWIAVRGSLDWRIVVLTGAVLLWVGGFDVLYACQDFDHDRKAGLNSVPQAFGLVPAFWIARAMHLGMLAMLCWLVVLFGLGKVAMLGIVVVAILLLYEHSIISPKDLRRMNAAFFTLNGVISVVFFGFVASDVLMRR
jgi:4-hydroxybenzoate polyprenyltransferase